MRKHRRNNYYQRPQMRLTRGADGRLRAAADGYDIGDLWAEQQRIRLAEAIAEDKKKSARKQKVRALAVRVWSRFGYSRLVRPHRQPAERHVQPKERSKTYREIVSRSGLPILKLPNMFRNKRAVLATSCSSLAAVALVLLWLGLYGGGGPETKERRSTAAQTLDNSVITEEPTYDTLLPAGKTIQDLGGWGRVSPPGSEPVFAFVDQINGIQINVSQQLLPANFGQDTSGQIAQIAEQFGANTQLSAGDTPAYLGTSIKGPQSVVLAKKGLLILMKSTSQIPPEHWSAYIEGLR